MTEPDIIEHEGRRFVDAGAGFPKKGQWYRGSDGCLRVASKDHIHGSRIFTELPAEPSPAPQRFNSCTFACDPVKNHHTALCVNRRAPAPQPPAQPVAGEAVRQLARKLKELPPISGDYESVIAAALSPLLEKFGGLLDMMETCHICKGALVLQEEPVHCEDCSGDCENHDEPACATIQSLHVAARKFLSRWTPKEGQ